MPLPTVRLLFLIQPTRMGCSVRLYHYPAATYPKGTMLKVYEWDTGKYLGEIEQARQTYNVTGNMNEFQVTIGETTFGGRSELADSTGIIDYGSLIYIGLQRSRSAREAIRIMTDLVQQYGYYSEGESFTIADPNEIWIMEMIGKGPGIRGAVWVAVRVPDDCISAHANQSRIHQFDMNDKENCITSPDVISFAREKGYFNGVNKDFRLLRRLMHRLISVHAVSAKHVCGAISINLLIMAMTIFLILKERRTLRCLFS